MKIQKILFTIVVACLIVAACKTETKKEEVKKEAVAADMQKVSLHVSGMTCEIGCAKIIQSKLSKKEGVTNATVIFSDSIATVAFDRNKTTPKDISSFITSIAGGDVYTASELK